MNVNLDTEYVIGTTRYPFGKVQVQIIYLLQIESGLIG